MGGVGLGVTSCGLFADRSLAIGPPGDRLLDRRGVAPDVHQGEYVDPVVANEVDRHEREPVEQHSTVGLKQDGPGLGKQLDALDLFIEPASKRLGSAGSNVS